jgi:MGT family glycosyltransferase
MKVLIACTPLTGHLNPLAAIGRILIEEGHEVIGMSASVMRHRIEEFGASFQPFPAGADLDLGDRDALFPEWRQLPAGPKRRRFALERIYVDTIAAQFVGLRETAKEISADLIIADNMCFGSLAMLLGPRSERPPIIVCGPTFLPRRRDDGAPNFRGLPPAANDADRQRYATLFKEDEAAVELPIRQRMNQVLESLGLETISESPFDVAIDRADAYLQLSVPEFEFPRSSLPASLHFVGTMPIIPGQAPLPPWAKDLDDSRKVVLVTQGTVSNFELGILIEPTLRALANESDILVVVTTGGRPIDAVPGSIPDNARLSSYLPFEWLLPKVDVLVTNGGYGSVNQALSFGVPLVTAGLSEDKAGVNARVAWSGCGIDLATNEPKAEDLRKAVRAVLDTTQYRTHAAAMAKAFSEIDTRAEILRIIGDVQRRVERSPTG